MGSSGPAIAGLSIADPPERWSALGFAVRADGGCQVGATELRLGAAGDGGIVGWTLTGTGSGDVAGIPTTYRDEETAGPAGVHPNGALSVDHVVLSTPDIDATFTSLGAAGMKLRRERTSDSGRQQGFFRHGEAILEVVGLSADATPRLWGLTIAVADLDRCAALLGDHLGDVRDAVQPGRRIATVRRNAGLRVPVAVMSA